MTRAKSARSAPATLLVALLLVCGGALAHHGWSGYLDDEFRLTGVVEAVHFGQPHGDLEVRNEEGLWDVVLGPPARNRRAGIVEDTIVVGMTVTAQGKRHRDPERLEMKTERLVVGDEVYDIYPERLRSS
jgi:hypothetical protein